MESHEHLDGINFKGRESEGSPMIGSAACRLDVNELITVTDFSIYWPDSTEAI